MGAPKSAASEHEVGKLHAALNRINLRVSEQLLEMLDSDDPEVRRAGLAACSPALLTSMGNWVRQNSVTCQPDEVEDIAANAELLNRKRKRGQALLEIPYTDTLN